jgi:uncharacterized protein (DUF111 family)
MHGSVYTLKAEFEPSRTIALETGVPVHEIIRLVEERAWQQIKK